MQFTLLSYLEQLWQLQRFPNLLIIETQETEATLEQIKMFATRVLNTQELDSCADFFSIIPDLTLVNIITRGELDKLQYFLHHTASASKIAVIAHANLMNLSAVNSCLKIFEDTPAGSYIFLLLPNKYQLSKVLRSRCQVISFNKTLNDYKHYSKLLTYLIDEQSDCQDFLQTVTRNAMEWQDFTEIASLYLHRLIKYNIAIKEGMSEQEPQISYNLLFLFTNFQYLQNLIQQTKALNLDKNQVAIIILAILQSSKAIN